MIASTHHHQTGHSTPYSPLQGVSLDGSVPVVPEMPMPELLRRLTATTSILDTNPEEAERIWMASYPKPAAKGHHHRIGEEA